MESPETLGRLLTERFSGRRLLLSLHLTDEIGNTLLSRTVLELDEVVAEEDCLSMLGGEVESGDAVFFEEVRLPLEHGSARIHEWGEGEMQVRSGPFLLTFLALGGAS